MQHTISVRVRGAFHVEDAHTGAVTHTATSTDAKYDGIAVGGVTDILAGVAAVSFPPAGVVLGGGAILATALAGSGIGAWLSSMIGVDVANTQIKQFEENLKRGEILFLVDVPKARVEEIEEMVKKHHPDADIEGTEPTIPAFP